MYRRTNELNSSPEEFTEKTNFTLDENNRWVILSKIIPWSEFEGEYASLFAETMGRQAKSFRVALGCLLIQHILNLSDRETVQQLKENPYLQYFLGFKCYEYKDQIDPSTLVYFRKRIEVETIKKINLKIVKEQLERQEEGEKETSQTEQKKLEIIKKLYEQQKEMYENNLRSIEGRIVSINQPYIRPIVRGKARVAVEFGAKISISYVSGYVFLDCMSWSNFNESQYLEKQVELYYQNFGYYPKSIHVDKIYRSKANRKYCQERGIRMSGPKLGRPPKNISKEEKQQALCDERIRNRVEGKFGEVKRRYGLDLIKTKCKETSENKIAMSILAMNLMTVLRRLLRLFWFFFVNLIKIKVCDKIYYESGCKPNRFTYM